ncbi:MAG: hypothetical protein KAV41_03505 [Candidatus Pacebacteria bacterium]|nr:hypothetical protein [Candidatus Paceibacterota bacterium]
MHVFGIRPYSVLEVIQAQEDPEEASLATALADPEEAMAGFVELEADNFPYLECYYEDGNYVFELKQFYLKITPFVIYNGQYYGIKQIVTFIKNNYPNVEYKWLIEKSVKALHYGFNLTRLPDAISSKIDYLGFRVTDYNFPLKWLSLYYDDNSNRTMIVLEKAKLFFSFHDLYPFGYSINYVNSTWLLIGNVTGRTNLYVDPIVLGTQDSLNVNGFSEGAECDYHTIYLYDMNGTYLLADDLVQGQDQSLDTQVRPADSGALQLRLEILTYNTPKGDIRLNGTDFFDNDIQESIEITATGNYTSTNHYKTILSGGIDIDPDVTVDIWQNRWGFISEMENSYYLTAWIWLKEDSWFADENKTVEFDLDIRPLEYIRYENNTHFRLGELFDAGSKTGNRGCHITISTVQVTPSDILGWAGNNDPDVAYLELYDSNFYAVSFRANLQLDAGSKVYNCKFQNVVLVGLECDLNYLTFHGVTYYQQFGLGYASGNTTNINIYNCYNAFWFYGQHRADIRDCTVRNVTRICRVRNGVTGYDHNLTNVDSDNWRFDFSSGSYPLVWRNYDFDALTVFKNGTAIEGANVTLSWYGQSGGTVGSWLTDSEGHIDTTITPPYGYYRKGGPYGTFYDYNPYYVNVTYGDYTYSSNFTHNEQTKLIIALTEPLEDETYIWFTLGLCAIPVAFALMVALRKRSKNGRSMEP